MLNKQISLILRILIIFFFQFICNISWADDDQSIELHKNRLLNDLDKSTQIVNSQLDNYLNSEKDNLSKELGRRRYNSIQSEFKKFRQFMKTNKDLPSINREYGRINKIISFKMYAGRGKFRSLSDKLKNNKNIESSQVNTAVTSLIDSVNLKSEDKIKFIINSDQNIDNIKNTLNNYDTGVILTEILNTNEQNKYYELKFSNKSIIGNEYLDDINNGLMPAKIIDYDIVEPNILKISTDYLAGEALNNLWNLQAIQADKFQKGINNQKKIKVGIIDSGIDYNHQDLKTNMYMNTNEIANNFIDDDKNGYVDDIYGYDFVNKNGNSIDDNGHGTHVAGIVGGVINGLGIFGVNSNVNLISLKVLSKDGYGSNYDIISAINYAINNKIDILNLSLAGNGNPSSDMLCKAIDVAKSKNILTVVAAGNENQDVANVVPAGCNNAITVGATDKNNNKTTFSNYGNKMTLAAPGVSIYSTKPGNSYQYMQGTSMATPHVAGLLAVVKAYKPDYSYQQIINLVSATANTEEVKATNGKNIGRIINMKKVLNQIGIMEDDYTIPKPNITGNIIPKPILTGINNNDILKELRKKLEDKIQEITNKLNNNTMNLDSAKVELEKFIQDLLNGNYNSEINSKIIQWKEEFMKLIEIVVKKIQDQNREKIKIEFKQFLNEILQKLQNKDINVQTAIEQLTNQYQILKSKIDNIRLDELQKIFLNYLAQINLKNLDINDKINKLPDKLNDIFNNKHRLKFNIKRSHHFKHKGW